MSPEVERVRAHGLAWARANDLVTTEAEVRRLDAPRFDRATARFTPDATGAGLDILGDTDLWFFLFDDFSDGPIGQRPSAVHQVIDPLVAHVHQDPAPLNTFVGSTDGSFIGWRTRVTTSAHLE
jgi:pentalenene synthase